MNLKLFSSSFIFIFSSALVASSEALVDLIAHSADHPDQAVHIASDYVNGPDFWVGISLIHEGLETDALPVPSSDSSFGSVVCIKKMAMFDRVHKGNNILNLITP
jgi:hypothetical protein